MNDAAKKEIFKQLRRLIALTTMGCLLFVSIFTVGAFSKRVTILDGEDSVSVVTMNTDTHKIIEQANINLSPEDLIFKIDNPDNSTEIVIKRAFKVNITENGNTSSVSVVMGTVADAVSLSGIILDENISVSPDLHTNLEPNMDISVEHRCKIMVTADGRTKEYSVPIGSSVLEALKFAEIPLYENDVVSRDLSEIVTDGMEIVIDRVGYRNKITTKTIPYQTVRKNVNYLDEGTTQVSVKGVNGESEIVIKETLKNGEVVSSEEVKNKVTVKPVNEVILVGTKKKGQTVQVSTGKSSETSLASSNTEGTIKDNNGKSLSYSKVLTGSGTAYTAESGAKTSTGTTPGRGTVAVNPNIIPYGTKLFITTTDGYVYGYATASDTGGALRQGTALVDLYMNSTQECLNFGRRTVKVYILN